MHPQSKINKVTNQKRPGKSRLAIGANGETTAIKFMPANDIDGKTDNKGQQHRINDQRGRAGIKPDNQRQPCNEFNEGQDDGQQIDEHCREKIVPIYNFGKNRRSQDFAVTGINKGRAEKPAGGQFKPAVA